ncbi:MAG: tetratricopeptide repeat protein, partial [Lutimonas sp.]
INSVEELFLTGNRLEQFYKYPDKYYDEVLKRDPGDTRTLTEIGKKNLKDGDFVTARSNFAKAIKRLTKDYTRPFTGEALFYQGIALKSLGLYDEAIDTLHRSTWDYAYYSAGFFELAQISCLQGDFRKGLDQINASLSTNTLNHRAVGFKASIQRILKDYKEAAQTVEAIYGLDPLNFRLANEAYLIAKASGNKAKAAAELETMTQKMRDFDQNYLELAIEYINDGMLTEAEDVLTRYKGQNPIVSYTLGYIYDKMGKTEVAKKHFSQAQNLSEEGCFPFRLETINTLKTALSYNKEDGMAYYYLGNILYNMQPELAISYWEKAVSHESVLAMAFRNLGWGYYRHYEDLDKAITYYEKAFELNNKEAIFYAELDELYELNNSSIAKRLAIFEGNSAVLNDRDDAFISQVTVLTLAGKPELSVQYLEGKEFSFREGNSAVREVIIDAQLALGIKYYNDKNYDKALEHFLLAQVPEEEAGSARSGNRSIQVNYYIGMAYKAMDNQKEAKKFFEKATVIEKTSKRRQSMLRGFMNYYMGLSYLELGEKAKADQIFKALVEGGNAGINTDSDDENTYFQIFGGKENENVSKSLSYTTRGLGYKGLGDKKSAKDDLSKAIELFTGNLWAQIELNELN